MKVIVYTALCGPKSVVQQPQWLKTRHGDPVEYVCFTDQPKSAIPSPWIVLPARQYHADPNRNAKVYKINPHLCLAPHDINVWVDANFRVTVGFDSIIDLLTGDIEMALFRHFERNCLYDEAEVCKAMGLDNPEIIDEQMARYAAFGFPRQYGLTECGTMIRKPTPHINKLMDVWGDEVRSGSRRDQLSFMYSVWALGMRGRVKILDQTSRDGTYHVWTPHLEMGQLVKV